jgi:hypothetical protein
MLGKDPFSSSGRDSMIFASYCDMPMGLSERLRFFLIS